MHVDVFNIKKEKVGSIELPDSVFAVDINEAVVWDVVKAQRASYRRGTHATKTRAFVRGGGRKPYKQKGTGQARQGSIRSPQFVGGGKVFGPKPRSYDVRPPKTVRRAALKSALSAQVKENKLVILDAFALTEPATKAVAQVLRDFGAPKALVVDINNKMLYLSARNLANAKYIDAGAINVYDILDHESLMMTKAAVELVVEQAEGRRKEKAA